MVYKALALVAFAAAAQLAAATPPACMLAAINTQEHIADFASICGRNAGDVQSVIQDVCGGDAAESAQKAFVDACGQKGHEVELPSASASSTGASPSSPSSTGSSSSSNNSQGSGSDDAPLGSSPTGSASPASQTGAASRVTIGAGIAGVVVAAVFAGL